ncbi:hypothetical protein CDAR_232871 [Caerostris darwini]|uniref:Uncharacterized protein n=1 Tax=Caerostris darwini TaxID=1538125 RepID=A0AAV4T325_9ARAC|nr:hypothetical protein CDAR_232871 [Caerostris darwini]
MSISGRVDEQAAANLATGFEWESLAPRCSPQSPPGRHSRRCPLADEWTNEPVNLASRLEWECLAPSLLPSEPRSGCESGAGANSIVHFVKLQNRFPSHPPTKFAIRSGVPRGQE